MSKVKEEAIAILENGRFGKAFPDIRKTLTSLAEKMDEVEATLASLGLWYHEDEEIIRGELVPFIFIGLVSTDSLLDGEKVGVDLS